MMTLDGYPIDPTIADYEGRQFALRHVSTATNGGNRYTVELVVTVRPDVGNLAFAVPQLASNVATFTKPFRHGDRIGAMG